MYQGERTGAGGVEAWQKVVPDDHGGFLGRRRRQEQVAQNSGQVVHRVVVVGNGSGAGGGSDRDLDAGRGSGGGERGGDVDDGQVIVHKVVVRASCGGGGGSGEHNFGPVVHGIVVVVGSGGGVAGGRSRGPKLDHVVHQIVVVASSGAAGGGGRHLDACEDVHTEHKGRFKQRRSRYNQYPDGCLLCECVSIR